MKLKQPNLPTQPASEEQTEQLSEPKLFQARVSADLKDWFHDYAQQRPTTESQALTELLDQLRLGNLAFEPVAAEKDKHISVRLNGDTLEWLNGYATDAGLKPAEVVRQVLEATRAGVISPAPHNPIAFPGRKPCK